MVYLPGLAALGLGAYQGARMAQPMIQSFNKSYFGKGKYKFGDVKHRRMPKNTHALAKEAWLAAQYVKGMTRFKKRTHDVTFAAQDIVAAGTINVLSAMAQGDSAGTRTSESIQVKSIEINFHINGDQSTLAALTTPFYQDVRLILFIDKATDAADPTVAEVLTAATPTSARNATDSDYARFRILFDRNYQVSDRATDTPAGIINNFPQEQVCRYYKKLDLPVKFLGTSAADTDLGLNHIFLLTLSLKTTGTCATFTGTSRIRYLDT